jgi:hypothetical protein
MPFLQNRINATVAVPAGQSICVGALRGSVATVVIPAGLRGSPITTVIDSQTVIGPFPAGASIIVEATQGDVEYVVGATPVLTDTPINPAAVAVTGGTINGTTIGATTPSTAVFTSITSSLLNRVTLGGTGTTLTAPVIQATHSNNSFTQIANQNKSATSLSSADMICYPDNNTNDTTGFVDIGVASSVFADPAYTITTPNDAYIFGSAVSGAAKLGNLVIATDSTGTRNDIVFGTGGFLAAKEKMRLKSSGALRLVPLASAPVTNVEAGDLYYNSALGKLQIRTASAWETITSV